MAGNRSILNGRMPLAERLADCAEIGCRRDVADNNGKPHHIFAWSRTRQVFRNLGGVGLQGERGTTQPRLVPLTGSSLPRNPGGPSLPWIRRSFSRCQQPSLVRLQLDHEVFGARSAGGDSVQDTPTGSVLKCAEPFLRQRRQMSFSLGPVSRLSSARPNKVGLYCPLPRECQSRGSRLRALLKL